MKSQIDENALKMVKMVTLSWLKENSGFCDTILSGVAEEVAPLVASQVQMHLAAAMSADGHTQRYERMLHCLRWIQDFLWKSCHPDRGHLPREFVKILSWHVDCAICVARGLPEPEKPKDSPVEGDIPF